MLTRSARLSSLALAFACIVAVFFNLLPSASGAASATKQLRRVKGGVGYQVEASAPLTPIFGKIDLPDDALAVTQADSVGELALPDSSIVTLGAGTRVQIGAFNTTAAGPGSTIVVNSGTLRFDIKRPVGGRANYQFQTPSSQIAVRGTIGLLSVINGITNVACVQCAADSVVVTTGGQIFTLATGGLITITAAGSAVTGTLTPEASAAFGQAGVGTGAGGAGSGAAAGIIGAAAGAAAAGIAAANANGTQRAVPTPTHSPSPSPGPTGTPVAGATPTSPGNVTVTGARRSQAPAAPGPTPAPPAPLAAPVQAPAPHPAMTAPELPGRGRR
jgi:hypothetical protein